MGLTEAGAHNRARQREEKLEIAETLLARHRSQCSEALNKGRGLVSVGAFIKSGSA